MMITIKRILCLLAVLLFLSFPEAKAQFDVHFSQYWGLRGFYNPAWAGQTDKMNFAGTYSMQLLGFTNAPRSMYFGADMPFSFLNKKHGVGLGFFNEGIGLFRNQRTWAQYSYKINIKKGKLGIGIQGGALNISFDPEKINLGDETEDEAFPTSSQSGTKVDFGFGLYYSHPKYYIGLSGQHLTAPTISLGDKSEIKVSPLVYLTGGYNIQTRNPLISIQPSFLLQSDFTSTRLDVTGRMFYTYNEKIFAGGVTYSPKTSVTFNIEATIKGITLGYAYELYTSKISAANGSHDLMVSYSTEINLFKRNKNKHKSIRIL